MLKALRVSKGMSLARYSRARSIGVVSAMILGALLAMFSSAPLHAKVFASQTQALDETFPGATRIDRDTKLLRRSEVREIVALTKDANPPKVVVIHTAWKEDALLGYAHIDVHNVRTKPEAFMVVLTPLGEVRSVRILAFHEPLDYLPTERWYDQFSGKTSGDRLRVGGDVNGVVGATLSARAAADGVRRMLAYWQVLLRPAEVIDEAP